LDLRRGGEERRRRREEEEKRGVQERNKIAVFSHRNQHIVLKSYL
jgi:hypothetical protein